MVEVTVAIVTRNNSEVLIVKRAKGEGRLIWQFPGGTIEPHESIEEATVRELKEETGITGKVIKVLGSRIHPYTKKHIAYVLCEHKNGDFCIGCPEIAEVLWVNIKDLKRYFTTPLFRPVDDYLNNLMMKKAK